MTVTEKSRMPSAAAPDLLTADDLLRLHSQGVRGELVRGLLHETMSSGIRHGKIAVRLSAKLFNFVEPRRLGTLVGSDSGVWLERDPDTVREPDLAFFSAEVMPLDADIPGYAEVTPVLVAEIRSPSDSLRHVAERAAMWLSHGVSLVWIVHPETRSVDVHRAGRPVSVIADNGTLDGGEVLEGFSCNLAEIFDAWPLSAQPAAGQVRCRPNPLSAE